MNDTQEVVEEQKEDEHKDEENYKDVTLADGSVFRLYEDDEAWHPVAHGLEDLAAQEALLRDLPDALEELSIQLSAFRRNAWCLRSDARNIVKRVEALNDGTTIRGRYADSPQKELDKAANLFVELVTDAVGSVAIATHSNVRRAQEDLEENRKWVAQRDEALRILEQAMTDAT